MHTALCCKFELRFRVLHGFLHPLADAALPLLRHCSALSLSRGPVDAAGICGCSMATNKLRLPWLGWRGLASCLLPGLSICTSTKMILQPSKHT